MHVVTLIAERLCCKPAKRGCLHKLRHLNPPKEQQWLAAQSAFQGSQTQDLMTYLTKQQHFM
jgi:hypothetical protein